MARLAYSVVQEEIEKVNWKLISKEYKNLNEELELRCPEDHRVFRSLKSFRGNQSCPVCEENDRVLRQNPRKKEKGITRVLALDDATQETGWCIFDGKELVSYGVFKLDNDNVIERIALIRQWLLNMLVEWSPDKVGIEDIQLQSFKGAGGQSNFAVTTFKVLAQLQGVLLEVLFTNDIEVMVIHSQTWKSYCGITARTRNDQKRAAQLKIKEWYDISVSQDEADAICLGRFLSEKYIHNNTLINWE